MDTPLTARSGVRWQVYTCFLMSRMLAIDETRQEGQLTQLTFEGFMEAIVRIAMIKALPTDREMQRRGFMLPGEYLGALLDQGSVFYEAWVLHAQKQQQRGRADPIWRRLDVLILVMVGVVQFGVEKQPGGASLLLRGSPDERLSLEEVKRYYQRPTRFVFEGGAGSKANKKQGK